MSPLYQCGNSTRKKCYVHCYLENVGILKDDELDRDRAIEMKWSSTPEALDECANESSGLYFFIMENQRIIFNFR